jgi:hypothetical protein
LRVGVPWSQASRAVAVLRNHGVDAFRTGLGDTTILLVPNLHERSTEEFDFAKEVQWLRAGGVQVRWASFPD